MVLNKNTPACVAPKWPHGDTVLTFSNLLSIGRGQKRTVYIDSPLLKTEMTVREMNHIYHYESLKNAIKKNGQKHIFHLMTELPANEKPVTSVCSCIIKSFLWAYSVIQY